MPIQTPGKRWGKRLQKSRVFGHGNHGKKSTFADLLITPLVDMFVIIVLFLIANFSATGEVLMMKSDIVLPEAVNVKEIDMAPVVMVSDSQIIVDGNVLGRVTDLMGGDDSNLAIPQLEEKLRDTKKQYIDLHALAKDDQGSGAFKGDVNIQASRKVPFKIIKKVMFSCSESGFNNINFAVMQTGTSGAEKLGATASNP